MKKGGRSIPKSARPSSTTGDGTKSEDLFILENEGELRGQVLPL